MELLAFVHSSVNYEDPTPDPELTLDIKVPSSTGVALAGVALAVAAVSASPGKAAAATPAIAQGSSGDAVTNVQKALGLQADGQFGPRTEASVMDFQIRQGLKQIDGVVGKETATALGLDEKYTPTCFGGGDCGWGGYGSDYRRIGGGYGGYVTVAFIPVVERYYGSYYEPYGYGDSCYSDCYSGGYYDSYGYDGGYYDSYGYDGGYYDSYGYGGGYYDSYGYGGSCGRNDCYSSYDHYYEPRSYYYDRYSYNDCYEPRYYEPYSYDCYEPRYYEPRGYDCYEPEYYEPYGYGDCYESSYCGYH